MALLASSISGAGYVMGNGNVEDKDNGNAFEFTRRKRWPQLLMQELVGSALFCLRPIAKDQGQDDSKVSQWIWKVVFVSPSIEEMVGTNVQSLEGQDFIDMVYAPDKLQTGAFLDSLLLPSTPSQPSTSSSDNTPLTPLTPSVNASRSQTTYIRVNTKPPPSKSRRGSGDKTNGNGNEEKKDNFVVWEVRAHTTGAESSGQVGDSVAFGPGGSGTIAPRGSIDGNDMKGRAVWVMGRAAADLGGETEGNGQSLDAFLELKLENEKLREELRELQIELGEDDLPLNSYAESSSRPTTSHGYQQSESSSPSETSTSPSSSSPSSPSYSAPIKLMSNTARPGRPPKDPAGREKKKAKKASNMPTGRGQVAGGEGGEGMHVCVTCGRTDSPEWRKGPLGPKTLCNACGLRWAKRNSAAPTRKDRKPK